VPVTLQFPAAVTAPQLLPSLEQNAAVLSGTHAAAHWPAS
jgi:hypothetical protein